MQNACAALYCHLWPLRLYSVSPHYLTNGTSFGNTSLNMEYVFWFSLQILPETFLVLRRTERDTIINVRRSPCKVPLFLSEFNESRIFSTDFRKLFIYQIPWKSSQWEPGCSIWTDRQTDMMKPSVAFRSLSKAPKNSAWCSHYVYMLRMYLRTNSNFVLTYIKGIVFINTRWTVFTARYALSLYIK